MSTRRSIFAVVMILFMLAVIGPVLRGFGTGPDSPGRDNPPPKAVPAPAATLMRKKLEHAQKVLEGLALNDLKQVGDHAADLAVLSMLAEFRTIKTAAYDRHTNDFRRALEDMGRGVSNKNLEAATLAYMDMTMSCVRCHTYVRETRIAKAD